MSGFAALMALSATQTKESQSAVQIALAQRQRKEELRRKQQEEREQKERELEAKLRQKHFEDEKREQERKQRKEQERLAAQQALQRREDEQRDALRYGPKKAKALTDPSAPRYPASSSQSRDEVRKKRLPRDDDDDDVSPALALTREEKRERKLQAEIRRTFTTAKRSTHTGGYLKPGRRLPGGAVDIQTPAVADESLSKMSVKERIAAMPNTLTKLNTVKRDTRTIDEILQDRAKARDHKVLDGDDAREFSDWFGKAKKKEPVKRAAAPVSAPTSGTNTPVSSQEMRFSSTPASSSVSVTKKANVPKPSPLSIPKATATLPSAKSTSTSGLKSATSSMFRSPLTKPPPKTPTVSKTPSAAAPSNSRTTTTKKRPRSPSMSVSPPPPKKRNLSPQPSHNSLKTEIWKMFGKDRGAYVARDVLSDDEDMEADARILEREEKMSARIAKKEEEEAAEAERRHEEEKRRRKKEKELREKRA